jgi:hypothetical protein
MTPYTSEMVLDAVVAQGDEEVVDIDWPGGAGHVFCENVAGDGSVRVEARVPAKSATTPGYIAEPTIQSAIAPGLNPVFHLPKCTLRVAASCPQGAGSPLEVTALSVLHVGM